jgi:hypothetical protein
VGWILAQARGLTVAVLNWNAGSSFLRLAVLLVGLLALLCLRVVFRQAGGRSSGNPLRVSMQPYRAIVLIMLAARMFQGVGPRLADVGDVADLAMLLFAAMALYLGACTERPPVRRARVTMASARVG